MGKMLPFSSLWCLTNVLPEEGVLRAPENACSHVRRASSIKESIGDRCQSAGDFSTLMSNTPASVLLLHVQHTWSSNRIIHIIY